MQFGVNVHQRDDGKFEWVLMATRDGFATGKMFASAVGFDSSDEANADADRYFNGRSDRTGRVILEKKQLEALLQIAVDQLDECPGVKVGRVYWHERDSSGCNWSLHSLQGQNVSACQEALADIGQELRRMYSISDEK